MIWIQVFIAVLITLVVCGYLFLSIYFSRNIARPKILSLEKEILWEKLHHLWRDFDKYDKESYVVEGYQQYHLNVELVKSFEQSNKYVIISHGYTSNRYGSVKYVDIYRSLGFNVIIYDVRGHGSNEIASVSLGNVESQDLLALIQDAYQKYGEKIYLGLHGESMGSSISLSVLKYQPNIKFVVADCGFANLYDLIKELYSKRKVKVLIYGVNLMMKLLYGYDMKETSAIEALKNNTVPILFIHGEKDTFIVPKHSERLAQATKGYQELHLIEHATHAGSRQKMGLVAYTELVRNFLLEIDSN